VLASPGLTPDTRNTCLPEEVPRWSIPDERWPSLPTSSPRFIARWRTLAQTQPSRITPTRITTLSSRLS
jgi:hypothetical protein